MQEYKTAGSKKEDQSSGALQELNNKELRCRQEKERDRAMNYTAYFHLLKASRHRGGGDGRTDSGKSQERAASPS